MFENGTRRVGVVICLALLGLLTAVCGDMLEDASDNTDTTGEGVIDESDVADEGSSGDGTIALAFSGENPAYHTGILSTPIRVTCGTEWPVCAAEASQSETFTEPLGSQTGTGTDTFNFVGTWNEETRVLTGRLDLTNRTASEGEGPTTVIEYVMTGDLQASAPQETDLLEGTVTGTSRNTQEWVGEGGPPPIDDARNISWTVTGNAPTGLNS